MAEKLKIKFGALSSMHGEAVRDGQLLIQGVRILSIEARSESSSDVRTLDLKDYFLLPGFVNAHCHLSLSALKGKLQKRERFTDWVRDLLRANAAVPFSERLQAMRDAAQEMTRSGVTSLADYLSQAELLPEYVNFPFRQILFWETLGFRSDAVVQVTAQLENLLDSFGPGGENLRSGIAPHAPYSVSPELFTALRKLARRRSAPWSCHVAEFPEEERFLREGGGEMAAFLEDRGALTQAGVPPGSGPVAYLDALGVLDQMTLIHANHIDVSDLDRIASNKASAVFCPGSSQWFGRREVLPIPELRARKIAVGLGTDSLASNESLEFSARIADRQRVFPEISHRAWLEMATREGAEALGLDAGILAPGRPADVVGFRITPDIDDPESLPFEKTRQNADFVMSRGKIVWFPHAEPSP